MEMESESLRQLERTVDTSTVEFMVTKSGRGLGESGRYLPSRRQSLIRKGGCSIELANAERVAETASLSAFKRPR